MLWVAHNGQRTAREPAARKGPRPRELQARVRGGVRTGAPTGAPTCCTEEHRGTAPLWAVASPPWTGVFLRRIKVSGTRTRRCRSDVFTMRGIRHNAKPFLRLEGGRKCRAGGGGRPRRESLRVPPGRCGRSGPVGRLQRGLNTGAS